MSEIGINGPLPAISNAIYDAAPDAQQTMLVTDVLGNAAPVVANPIADVNASEDDLDLVIDLTNVFNDEDDDNASITKVAVSSDDTLVTASVDANHTALTLDYQPDQFGAATITVTATSNGFFVDEVFTVTVDAVDDAPVVANVIPDVTATEDDPDL